MPLASNVQTKFEHKVKLHKNSLLITDAVYKINRTAPPGGRLNKKDGLTRYGDSHVKDKTS